MSGYERDMWMLNATPQDMLEEFILVMGQQDVPPDLGIELINEEFNEWLFEADAEDDLAEIKELADLVYVSFWRAERKGWDLMEALRRVHESNMSKLVDGQAIFNEDGKVMKGPNYHAPDLEDLV